MTDILEHLKIAKQKGEKKFIILIDPDELRLEKVNEILELATEAKVDYFFVGGSLILNNKLDDCLENIRKKCNIPLILFPGSPFQISNKADGILFLSLISGRNPDLLIGQHVIAAPYLKKSTLEVLATAYMLIDGGVPTTVSYISNTKPIPADKEDIAICTAIAGELLGLQLVYMDAGSGAKTPISESMIKAVSASISVPLIVGGGIKTPEKVWTNLKAGADLIVVGNAIEKDPKLLLEMAKVVRQYPFSQKT